MNVKSEKLLVHVTARKGMKDKSLFEKKKGIWLQHLDFGVLCE